MYCSACGVAVAHDLNYCKRCGARLNVIREKSTEKSREMPLESLVWAMVVVFVVGLGSIIGLMAVMKSVVGFNNGLITAVTVLSFISMLGIEWSFFKLLVSRFDKSNVTAETLRLGQDMPIEIDQPRDLAEPLMSITEQTTSTFDPTYHQRNQS